MNEILATLSLTTCTCSCGGVFAISEDFRAEAQRLGNFKKCWTCPYCESKRGYGESAHSKELNRLEQELADNKRWLANTTQSRDHALAEAEHFRKSRDGMKGALVKVQVRVKNGVCPCCTRSFTNLAAHMATKHPTFACEKTSP